MWGKTIDPTAASRYYNPLIVVGIKRQQRIGQKDLSESTICHAERTNLSVRTDGSHAALSVTARSWKTCATPSPCS